jgi:hypothetical protein
VHYRINSPQIFLRKLPHVSEMLDVHPAFGKDLEARDTIAEIPRIEPDQYGIRI